MKSILNPLRSLHARRLIVALAITGAAAAVASAVVLSERPVRNDVLTTKTTAPIPVHVPADPSLPSAGDVLGASRGASNEAAPTF